MPVPLPPMPTPIGTNSDIEVKKTVDGYPGLITFIQNFEVTQYTIGEEISTFTFDGGSLVITEASEGEVIIGVLNVLLYGDESEAELTCQRS